MASRKGARWRSRARFRPPLDSPDHIALAEELGYDRAWLYDTPQQSTDVWVTLALAAERTERIGLGPGVLVPSLRHPMVNAAATANLVALAPGRVAVAFGTGFTGRRAMGYRAIPWAFMDAYIRAYRGLLRGETIEWEGARMRMLHPPGHGARAPGRRADQHRRARARRAPPSRASWATASTSRSRCPSSPRSSPWVSYLFWGTIRDDDEDPESDRVRAAGGPGWALAYHGAYEFGTPLEDLPGGAEWKAVVEQTAPEERHLAVHAQHCVGLNEADEAAWDAGGHRMLDEVTMSGTADQVRERLAEPRRARRDRGRLPAMRARHPARARSVHGHREGRRRGLRRASMATARTLTPLFEGGNYFECPRWHDGRWWASDFYRHAVFTYDADGREEQVIEVEGQPSGLGLAARRRPAGRVDEGPAGAAARGRRRASASPRRRLASSPTGHLNDMVVDRQGRAYVGNFGFDLMGGGQPATATLVRIDPDGSASVAAEDLWFPNGMVITDDGTLIVAETFARPLHGLHDRGRRLAGRPPRVGAGPAGARARRHGDDARCRHLRARRLRAGRRGPRVGRQRARRGALTPRRPRRRDRRRDRDARRASASSRAGSAARTGARSSPAPRPTSTRRRGRPRARLRC